MAATNFFISYTGADAGWAEWIGWQLEDAGYTVALQAWDSRPGNDFLAWMDRQVRDADRILVVLSPAYEQATSFTVPEWTAALGRDPTGRLGVLLPVRVADFLPGGLFRTRTWVDLAGKDPAAARAALLAGIRQERMKPSTEPAWPGGPGPCPAGAEPAFPGPDAGGRIWNLPVERNPAFTGRDGLLGRLRDSLGDRRRGPARVVLTGIGGVGKTALAVEYANAHRDDYDLVWWARAEQPETLAADLAGLADWLALPEAGAAEQELVLGAVRRWLTGNRGWLLVFDDAQPTDAVVDLFPRGDGAVLVTSRDPAWRRQVTALLSVEVLDRAESVRLLRRRTGDDDEAAADRLAEALGDLPLALEQAGAYCETEQLPLAVYLRLFDADAAGLLGQSRPTDYAHTVATTWSLAVAEAGTRSAAAPDLLRLLAHLSPDTIPWDLLAPGMADLRELPGSLFALDTRVLDRALGALARYSLVSRSSADVTVHRLVQQVVRDGLDSGERLHWAPAAVQLLAAVFPHESDLPQQWPVCRRLLPHALAALDHLEAAELLTSAGGPLANQVGVYFQGRAELPAARSMYERARRMDEDLFGPDHPRVAVRLNNLGEVLRQLGDLSEARDHFERALGIVEAADGLHRPDPLMVAAFHSNLGATRWELGELLAAIDDHTRALEIAEAAGGPDHPDVALILINLGYVRFQIGDLAGAAADYRRALAIAEAAHGPDHPDVAEAMSSLGGVQVAAGDPAGARASSERALGIVEAAYGPDHPIVARYLNNLAGVQSELGDLAGARASLERALRIDLAAFGPAHPHSRRVADNLAWLDDRQKGRPR